jgi:hypothetical protein
VIEFAGSEIVHHHHDVSQLSPLSLARIVGETGLRRLVYHYAGHMQGQAMRGD